MNIQAITLKDFIGSIQNEDGNRRAIPQQPNQHEHEKGDTVEISKEAKEALFGKRESKTAKIKGLPGQELTDEERREVEKLKKIDAEVRRHEMAHKMAGGGLTGQIVYEYKTGPDGKKYAVAGHVSIDTSPEKDPEATLRKAAAIKRAALAPSNPSPADRKVAQKAQQMEAEARREIQEEQREKMAERMKEMQEKMAETSSSNNSTALNALAGASSLHSINGNEKPQQFISPEKVKNLYDNNSSSASKNETAEQEKPKIRASSFGPAVSTLDQTDEEVQEESVPEVSPVE